MFCNRLNSWHKGYWSSETTGIPLDRIAVLYRAHYHCMELQMELTRRDIPFEVRSGLRFFEQAHIKDVVAHMRVMANPTDEISWKRILKMAPHIGKKTADRTYDYLKTVEDPIQLFITKKIGEQLKSVPGENLEAWSKLFKELDELKAREALSDMISAVLKHGYTEYLKLNFPNHESRLEDLTQLMNFSTKYQSLVYLSERALVDERCTGEEIVSAGYDDERVVFSTVHQAKGLEWKVVFIIWCAEGRFPNPKAYGGRSSGGGAQTFLCSEHTRYGSALSLLSAHCFRQAGGSGNP